MNTWYEVYEGGTLETQTLAICETLKEARKVRAELAEFYRNVHIDQWKNKDNPEIIKAIE